MVDNSDDLDVKILRRSLNRLKGVVGSRTRRWSNKDHSSRIRSKLTRGSDLSSRNQEVDLFFFFFSFCLHFCFVLLTVLVNGPGRGDSRWSSKKCSSD